MMKPIVGMRRGDMVVADIAMCDLVQQLARVLLESIVCEEGKNATVSSTREHELYK